MTGISWQRNPMKQQKRTPPTSGMALPKKLQRPTWALFRGFPRQKFFNFRHLSKN